MIGCRASRVLLLTLLLPALSLGFGFGKGAAKCDLSHMLQCMTEAEASGVRFEQRLGQCQRSVCPGGENPNSVSELKRQQMRQWEEEDMLSELFIQKDATNAQYIKVDADKDLCSKDELAAFELSTKITLPFSGCDFNTATAECTCNAKLPMTGIYVAVDKNQRPRTRRLAYVRGSVPTTTKDGQATGVHNIWMEGAHRLVLIGLSTVAFIGNFIFLVQVFWMA